MRVLSMLKQITIALVSCLLLPLLGLELLFMGPELGVDVRNVSMIEHKDCSELVEPTIYYLGSEWDDLTLMLGWRRTADIGKATIVLVDQPRNFNWTALYDGCQRVNAIPDNLALFDKGDFVATMRVARVPSIAQVPVTFLLNDPNECLALHRYNFTGSMWVVRSPTTNTPAHQLVLSLEDVVKRMSKSPEAYPQTDFVPPSASSSSPDMKERIISLLYQLRILRTFIGLWNLVIIFLMLTFFG